MINKKNLKKIEKHSFRHRFRQKMHALSTLNSFGIAMGKMVYLFFASTTR